MSSFGSSFGSYDAVMTGGVMLKSSRASTDSRSSDKMTLNHALLANPYYKEKNLSIASERQNFSLSQSTSGYLE